MSAQGGRGPSGNAMSGSACTLDSLPLRPHCTFVLPRKPPTTAPLLSITIIFFLTFGVLRPPIVIFVLKELVFNLAANALQMSCVMMLMPMIAFLPNLVTTPFYLAESFSMAPYLGL